MFLTTVDTERSAKKVSTHSAHFKSHPYAEVGILIYLQGMFPLAPVLSSQVSCHSVGFATWQAWSWQSYPDVEGKAHKHEQGNRTVGKTSSTMLTCSF